MNFVDGFKTFLDDAGISYEMSASFLFFFPGKDVKVELVPLGHPVVYTGDGRKYLFEDVWNRSGEVIRRRMLAHLGRFRSVFARNCSVVKLDTPEANAFLSRYHTYGAARSKYRYGLELHGELLAVASFSSGRPMQRERVLQSYEWVRYASLPDTRVVGGMGKLMNAFIDDVHPEEIMSYADLEWSDGSVYRTLGFREAGRRDPVEFFVDTCTWERLSVRKLSSDRAYRTKALTGESLVRISNLGSVKYLKTI